MCRESFLASDVTEPVLASYIEERQYIRPMSMIGYNSCFAFCKMKFKSDAHRLCVHMYLNLLKNTRYALTHFSRDTELSVFCTIANRPVQRPRPTYVGLDLGSSLFAPSLHHYGKISPKLFFYKLVQMVLLWLPFCTFWLQWVNVT